MTLIQESFEFLYEQLDDAAQQIISTYEMVFVEVDKVATGETVNSLSYEVDTENLKILIYAGGAFEEIERGRKRFEVFLDDDDPDLLAWMRSRGIPEFGASADEIAEVAPRISDSIYSKALPGVPITKMVLEREFPDPSAQISQKLLQAFATDLNRNISVLLQSS